MSDSIRLTGYYALLSYYSGLRFGDAVSFDYKKKVIEDSTGKRLVLYAAKNGEIVSIAFTKYIAEVVEFIKDKTITITNQDFNSNLKIITGIAEIAKDVSSHTGRHSFAMRCAELGMSIDDVQKLLGHNKRSSTEIYFRIKNRRLDDVMKKWEE
jgi:integrase